MSQLVHHFLEKSAKIFPDKTALIHDELRLTYSRLNLDANCLAIWLIHRGIKKGDRIALIYENCMEYVISYYGILKAGAIAVPINTDIKPHGLISLLNELDPKIIIASYRFERVLRATNLNSLTLNCMILKNPKINWGAHVAFSVFPWDEIIAEEAEGDIEVYHNIDIQASDTASIIYTSGSTGTPRGVMLSHKNIVSNTESICQYLHLTEKDIQMVVLPLFYVMGKSLLNTHFAVGATIVINNKFAFPAAVINQMIEEGVTGFSGVPSTYAYLLHRSPLEKKRDQLQTLRYCTQAGGHMSRQLKESLIKVLPVHTKIYIMYGATEASARLTYLDPDMLKFKIDSIGKPVQGVTIRILDDNGNDVPNGEIGEIVTRGPNIMKGYWKDETETQRVLDKNGYHTGDLGFMDSEGFLYVQGRKDNLLKVGGHRINPQEIEDIIMNTGYFIESAVIGMPDEMLGNRLVAMGVPVNESISPNKILGICSEKLPAFKVPSELNFVKSLPKKSSGKIDREKCVELYE